MQWRHVLAALGVLLAACGAEAPGGQEISASQDCIDCHKELMPGLHRQWAASRHGELGVGCLDCHAAAVEDPDGFDHFGIQVATLVTPKDCGTCHTEIAKQVGDSHHATAGRILESEDAYLANVVGGRPVAVAGCESCHGSKVEIDPESPNKLSAKSWPNSGIGRINPDGSLGTCTACHTRHNFDKAQARRPEACGKCHLGPDHPQSEAYASSKHGNVYYTNIDKMNLAADPWVVGVDYWVAPTCATCHMSATPNQVLTHDVGERISWTLRPAISVHTEDWERKRQNMIDTCTACHSGPFAEGFYVQFDAVVRLYNEKFAKPATEIMELVRSKGLLENDAAFGNEIEWEYWELWHHQGRVARHGASKMSPDYTWWHGMYEVAHSFYFKLIPLARAYGDPDVNARIEALLAEPMHQWFQGHAAEIEEDLRAGRLQKVYDDLFSVQP